jgi:transglycosylase-like protein with SLT domain
MMYNRVSPPAENRRRCRRRMEESHPISSLGAMATKSRSRASRYTAPRTRVRLVRIPAVRRLARARRRALSALRALPLALRVLVGAVVILAAWSVANWGYQVIRKPTELFFPVSGALAKSPPETWRTYGPLFTEHATAVISPELLAALAQVESGGNPVARTYWRWRPTTNPLEWYQPASSAVGMYQITDGTFQVAKHYCVHHHVVVEDGPWDDVRSCWFNSLYTRVLPSHAIELTAALLDRSVTRALEGRIPVATLRQQQDLAAVIHLCGAGAGAAYAAQGFRLTARQQCGDHDVRRYLAQVNLLKRQFARLAPAG